MQKLIHQQLAIIATIFLLEIFAGIALFFLIDGNYLVNYQTEILIGCLIAVILINLVIMLLSFSRISNAKSKSDISTLKVLGNDVQEAYDFGKIGLIITDQDDEIIWVNRLFTTIQGKLVDHNLYEYFPKLRDFKANPNISEMKVEFDNCFYQVKYLPQANLYIFKDVSSSEEILNYSKAHSPAVGIIAIDNYQDMANILDDISINDNLSVIQKVIGEYAKKHHLLLKKYKSDSYMFICFREDYDRMLEEKFVILQDIKEEKTDNDLTLSLGVASGLDNYNRLFEMASSALDVALSRGGDQVVVSTYGENLRFFGGQTEAKEKKNSVQSRVMSNSLKTLIEEASAVYIMGHDIADLDAIGSSLGLYCFAKAVDGKKKIKIVYDEFALENKTKKAFKQEFTKDQISEMTITPAKALDEFTSKALLIMTDFHNPNNGISPSLIKKAEKIAVIDHHRRSANYVERAEFTYIEPSASSASELVAEMIRYSSISIAVPSTIATFMLAGIILDTNYYRIHIGARTYDASYVLKGFGADNALADSFLKVEYEEYALKTKILSNSTTPYYGIILAKADQKDIVEQAMLARVASETLQISGINACFVVGRISDKEVGVSSRSDGTVSCQILCEKLGGGGSFTAAAAKFSTTSVEEVSNRILYVLDQYLNDARQKKVGD